MVAQHQIVELDHMDAKTADSALAVLHAYTAPGVISANSWDSPRRSRDLRHRRLRDAGRGSSPSAFVTQWRDYKKMADARYPFGFATGRT